MCHAGEPKPSHNEDVKPGSHAVQGTSDRTASRSRLAATMLALVLAAMSTRVGADASVTFGDAFVREAAGGRQWEIGNAGLTYALALTSAGELEVRGLARPGHDSVV